MKMKQQISVEEANTQQWGRVGDKTWHKERRHDERAAEMEMDSA